jgi:hypothetical protein
MDFGSAPVAHPAPKTRASVTLSDLSTELRSNFYSHLLEPRFLSLFEEDADLYYESVHDPAALAQASKSYHVDVTEHYRLVTWKRPVAILCRKATYELVDTRLH